MRQQLAMLIPTALVGGCSLIYNPSNISKPPPDAIDAPGIDAEMTADARIDAPPIFDANPGMLMLEDVAPNVIYEGQGQGGSRAALLVIRGHHIIADGLSVTITPSTGLTLGSPMVSNNGDFIAIPVAVAIDGAAATGTTPLAITVEQTGGPAGGVQLTGKLALAHLPEFPAGTTIATSSLAPLYSQIDTNSNVTFTGDATQPAVLRSVSSIKIGDITVAGAAGAAGNNLGAGGPGGCPGGKARETAGCAQTDGAGGGGAGNAGGGGGGFSAAGGGGNGGGAAGVVHGNPQLVNYSGAAGMTNQGAGGGGGGAETLSNAGAGGGGGGTIELTAGGDITVGTINANGGKGGNATTLITGAGGGGGGSGGVVVLRSDTGTLTAGAISALGGAAGAGAGSGGGGGMGGPGRVRADYAMGSLPSASPAARRGVSFAANTPTIVPTDNPMVTLSGTTGDIVDFYVIDADDQPHFGEPMNLAFGANGTLSTTVTLLPGYNRLCATLRPGTRGHPDQLADTCLEMVYLP